MGIKIDEAISLLTAIRDDRKAKFNLDDDHPGQQAILLAIEALNVLKHFRIGGERGGLWKLPGETEE